MTIKTKSGETELASPFEVFPHYLELPPLKREHVAGAARFKLRSMHPGNPDSTRIDVRPANATAKTLSSDPAKNTKIIAHAAPVSDTPEIQGLPTLPGYALLAAGWREYRKGTGHAGESSTGLLIADGWIQGTRFENGIAVAGNAQRFTGAEHAVSAARTCTSALSPSTADSSPSGLFIIHISTSDITRMPLIEGYSTPVYIDQETVLARINLQNERLFKTERPGSSRFLRATVAGLAAITLFSVAFRLHRTALYLESEATEAKKTYATRQTATTELLSLMNERDTLADSPNGENTEAWTDAYTTFSRLAGILPGTALTSITLQADNITFTAHAPDALVAVARLRNDPFFADISLVQASPLPEGGETFTVKGKVSP